MEDPEELLQTWIMLVAGLDSGFWIALETEVTEPLDQDPTFVMRNGARRPTAFSIAAEFLRQWASAGEVGHRRLASLFLSAPQPSFREHVEQLAAGTELKDLPTLFQSAVFRFRFTPIAERRIEEKHARLARRAVAPQYGRAYASNTLRLNHEAPSLFLNSTMSTSSHA